MANPTCGDPSIDNRLSQMLSDGIPSTFFTCPCTVRFSFLGDVQVSLESGAARFSGQARLEAPFALTTALLVQIEEDGDYLIRFSMSDAHRVVESIVNKAAPAVRETVKTLVTPYLQAHKQCGVLLASKPGADDTFGPYVSGINFVGTIVASAVEPLRSLDKTFPMLKLRDRTLQLHTASLVGSELSFVVEGNLVLDAALGSPTVVLRTVGLRVDQSSKELAACASVVVGVRAGKDDLIFTGSLTGSIPAQVTLALSLDVADGAWEKPFGLEGVTITNAGLQVGASPKAPYVSAGVRGGFAIGGDALRGEAAILIDPGSPEKTIFYLESPDGLHLQRVLGGLVDEGLVPAEVLDASLRKLKIYAAPSGGFVANREFAAGFEIDGVLDLWGFDANLSGRFSYAGGGSLQGKVDRILLAKEATVFEISDGDGGGPSMNIQFNPAARGQHLKGTLRVGGDRQSVDAAVGKDGFSIALKKEWSGLYAGATMGYRRGTASASVSAGFDMQAQVGAIPMVLEVHSSAAVSASQAKATARASLSVSAFGTSATFGPEEVSVAVTDVRALKDLCNRQFGRALSDWATRQLRTASAEVAIWLQSTANMGADLAVTLFRQAQADCGAVVTQLEAIYRVTDVGAAAMLDKAGFASIDIAKGIGATYGRSAEEVGKILRAAGCSSKEIAAAMKGAYGWGADKTAKFMKDTLSFGDKAVSEALGAAGYAESAVKEAMEEVYGWGEDAWNDVAGALGL